MIRIGVLLFAMLAMPLMAQKPKGPKLPDGVTAHRDVAYGPHDRNKLDVYLPKSDMPLPLIIWVHGGGWAAGSKDSGGPAIAYLDRGYAVASINYRLSQHAIFPAQIEDCQSAVRFLRSKAKDWNLKSDRFAAWGSSAGGHLVALLGTSGNTDAFEKVGTIKDGSCAVQAVVDWFGPTDLTLMASQTKIKGPIDHDSATSPESKLIGGAIQSHKDKAKKANPLVYVDKDDPPMLIMHGDIDPLVPLAQSEILHEALKKAGVESKLVVATGVGHSPKVADGDNSKIIDEFLKMHLKK
jgi:acetyl esterase/lipase